jgi:GH15 family glucan-1,4-alpha-glucosidase
MRSALLAILVALITLPAFSSSHLVTGNGHGFAVVDPDTARITKFYAHPYSYTGPVPGKPYAEGIETTNFLDSIVDQVGPTTKPKVEFVNDSHIIRVARHDGGVFSCFMPFGLKYSALVLVGDAERKKVEFLTVWARNKSKLTYPKNKYQAPYLLQFEGIKDSILEIPLDSDAISLKGVGRGQIFVGSWVLISIENESEVAQVLADFERWRSKLSAQQLLDRELADFEAWRVQPAVHFRSEDERHLWRQSETMLRIAQSREENRPGRYNHGMIVACLPDGVFFTHWVRDMAWATLALIRMGHKAEAREAILAYFNARPMDKMRAMTNNADYQVSVVRYFGNGEEEPFFTMEGQPNVEFDNWGEVLWVLGEYQAKFNDPTLLTTHTYRGTVYESARDFILKPLLANTEPYKDGYIVSADTSIWEEHQVDKKHFAFSTAMAIEGIIEFAPLVQEQKEMALYSQMLQDMLALQDGFYAAFMHHNVMHGTLEENAKNEIDGALLPINNLELFKTPEIRQSTADRMEELKVVSGGYARVKSNYTDPAIYEYWYEREEFVFTDLALAELDWRIGRNEAGDKLLDRITQKSAADHNTIPEMYVALPCKLFPGKIGDPTGALPMVGYGAGAYILTLMERESIPHSTSH